MKKSTIFLTFVSLALLFTSSIISCDNNGGDIAETPAESTFDLTTARTEIIAANQEFMTLFAAGDSVGLTGLYTQDAKFMMNGSPAISGLENIRSVISAIMSSGISSVDLRTLDVWGTEDLVVEEGELSLFAGDDEVDQGKYIVLWKKEDGKWNLYRDIFNSDLAAE